MTGRTAAVLRVWVSALACAAVLVPIAVTGQAPAEGRAGGWTAPRPRGASRISRAAGPSPT